MKGNIVGALVLIVVGTLFLFNNLGYTDMSLGRADLHLVAGDPDRGRPGFAVQPQVTPTPDVDVASKWSASTSIAISAKAAAMMPPSCR